MKTAFWTAADLNQLLAGLERQGVKLHAGVEVGEIFILTDWKHDRGDIMFAAKFSARVKGELADKGKDVIMYEVSWTPAFEKAMENITHAGLQ
jgi:hypothetical protein